MSASSSSLKAIRLELGRTRENPEGNPRCGYEFTAPLTADGHLDPEGFKANKAACRVTRFWEGEKAEQGALRHLGPDRWVFSYAPGSEDDEPAFKFEKHRFAVGEYVSITEHDGVTRPFKVVSLK
ncbi:hypothetical protein [Dongia sp.]|jgi:hypothetical protein|uniref:hypothetical protein n=1 Tax=Dongia sp. TaxID=1977262 RepID=UPI0034A2F891